MLFVALSVPRCAIHIDSPGIHRTSKPALQMEAFWQVLWHLPGQGKSSSHHTVKQWHQKRSWQRGADVMSLHVSALSEWQEAQGQRSTLIQLASSWFTVSSTASSNHSARTWTLRTCWTSLECVWQRWTKSLRLQLGSKLELHDQPQSKTGGVRNFSALVLWLEMDMFGILSILFLPL